MSLKNRLRISIVTLVTLIVFAQGVVALGLAARNSFQEALLRARAIANQVRIIVLQRVNEQTAKRYPIPSNLEESKALWDQILREDPELPGLLTTSGANWLPLVEILICDENGVILTGTQDRRSRSTYQSLPDFEEWQLRNLWDRMFEVLFRPAEYVTVIPIGVQGAPRPLYTIRVILSSVLLRGEILKLFTLLGIASMLSVALSTVLAVLYSNVVLRAFDRIARRIELISTGRFTDAADVSGGSRELAAVQSKLDVLSQQFRGAKEDVIHLRGNIEQMLDRLEQAVLLFDPERRLVLASRPAERLLGRPLSGMAGHSMEELLPATTSLGAVLDGALRRGQPLRNRPTLLERDGGLPWRLLLNVELLTSATGESIGTLVTIQDTETRRQLSSQLDVSTRLAAISRLTGGVAHEIKNPLNAMALHLEILRSKLPESTGVEGELEVIGGEIARLDRVVKTFLDFTRPVELSMDEVDLLELCAEISTLVAPDARGNNVLVDWKVEIDRAVVRGDRDLLKQAILNVVMNGIEAMPMGGRLRLRVEREGPEAVVSVSDEGLGIPPQLREKVFNLYFSTKEKGTGIGLAMTFRVVQLHNATIDFTSETGRGTTFTIRLPTVADDSVARPEEAAREPVEERV
jgi:signal transduction histidine kinase